MNEGTDKSARPRKILLATDMSARCDRALDRAVQLAGQWDAELVVVHAASPQAMPGLGELENMPSWRRPPDRLRAIRRQVADDLRDVACRIDLHVEAGRPIDVIMDVAERTGCDLVVTGIARDEPFGRSILGDTVDQLMRKSRLPLLVVRSKARQAYEKVIAAIDFSVASRHALRVAVDCFPGAHFTLFNAYDAPFATYLGGDQIDGEFARMKSEACERFLAESGIDPAIAGGFGRLIEYGAPEVLLRDYARTRRVDLTVVGSHGRSAVYDALIGDTARKIVDASLGDVLLVRDPNAR